MASKARLSADVFDMIFNFILREKRFLKKRETSLTQEELNSAEEVLKRSLKAISAKKHTDEEMREIEASDSKSKKLAKDVGSKCKPLTPKQVLAIVTNYSMVHNAIEKKHKEHKLVIEAIAGGDKFYKPRKRTY